MGLHQLQALPLSVKIKKTEYRIREWAEHYGKNSIFLAFSGGKDSSVLMHIARKIYPEIPAVYVNTGLEFPEVQEFVKRQENVEIQKSPMHSYAKKTGRMPVTAQLASESRLRTTNWLKNGCNGFHMKSPISNLKQGSRKIFFMAWSENL